MYHFHPLPPRFPALYSSLHRPAPHPPADSENPASRALDYMPGIQNKGDTFQASRRTGRCNPFPEKREIALGGSRWVVGVRKRSPRCLLGDDGHRGRIVVEVGLARVGRGHEWC